MAYHLYEVVLTNSRVWLKVQASCSSPQQAEAFFAWRFTGADRLFAGRRIATPFKLSERSDYLANWTSIANSLPVGWDGDDYHMPDSPYPWCESLSDGCNCQGSKRILRAVCSGIGLHQEQAPRASRSQNVHYSDHIQALEQQITQQDENRRKDQPRKAHSQWILTPRTTTTPGSREPKPGDGPVDDALDLGIREIDRLVAQGLYCSIHENHHPYGDQARRKTVASLAAIPSQVSTWPSKHRHTVISNLPAIAGLWLGRHQAEECAQRALSGGVDLPKILYKYIPKNLIGRGPPSSLRATQLAALNDVMECNVLAMSEGNRHDSLSFLRLVRSKLKQHLGIAVEWEELLVRRLMLGDLQLSAYLQDYLSPRVGIVSFSTDLLVPTMWAHYAKNSGIVVGYDTEALRPLGFELRPVVYSRIVPKYRPSKDDGIRLDFVDREDMDRDLRTGRTRSGVPVLTSGHLTQFRADWRSLSRLLLVKGVSWAYEKEVRLLVDLSQSRDTGDTDRNGFPVRVVDPPPEAIKEIYCGPNTGKADIERAILAARGGNKSGLFVGHVAFQGFRIQKTGGSRF